MSLLVVVFFSDNLMLLVSDLILGQSLFFIVSVLLSQLHPLDDSVYFLLSLLIDLLLLEVQIIVDHPSHRLDIWESLLVVLFHQIS